jgi:predicted metal-dependent RNase
LRQDIEPLKTKLTTGMNRFLRDFPDERADLLPQVGSYLHVVKNVKTNQSEVFSMTARGFEEVVAESAGDRWANGSPLREVRPR